MAEWVLIEHSDHSDARELGRGAYREMLDMIDRLVRERARAGSAVEPMNRNVWMCTRPANPRGATVLRLVTAAEWKSDWMPLKSAV